MLSNLENSILKELDKQNFRSDIISIVMDKLNTEDKQNKFLSYMIKNRNIILSLADLFSELKLLDK